MKKVIQVRVGSVPEIIHGRNGDELKYVGGYCTLYPEGSLDGLLSTILGDKNRYDKDYTHLSYVGKQMCGCYGDCSCDPEYILHGLRLETDVELSFRLDKEKKAKDKLEAAEKAQYEKLKEKFNQKGDK